MLLLVSIPKSQDKMPPHPMQEEIMLLQLLLLPMNVSDKTTKLS